MWVVMISGGGNDQIFSERPTSGERKIYIAVEREGVVLW